MGFSVIEDDDDDESAAVYICDECGLEMDIEADSESQQVKCMTEGCKCEGIRYTIWMSEELKEDIRADEKIHDCEDDT